MILVVGDFMVDEYVHVAVDRISPEAPVPIMREIHREVRPGGAGNVAANIASLGGNVQLKTVVGTVENRWWNKIIDSCRWLGWIQDLHRPTTVKTRFVADRGQQLARLDHESTMGITDMTADRLLDNISFESVNVLVISDYQKGVVTRKVAEALIRKAVTLNIPVIVDSKSDDYTMFRGATIATPNQREWDAVRESPDDLSILVTMGAKGMRLLQRGYEVSFPAVDRHDVADVTGAGDTVVAALAVWFANGGCSDLEGAVDFANRAASVAVSKRGTHAVTRKEME